MKRKENSTTTAERTSKTAEKSAVRKDPAVSSLASQRAAAILDVLAGQRSPSEAAAALEISVNHYYQLERRALEGLTTACEPQPKGPKGPSLESQLESLQRQLDQCRRDGLRQAALVRATQRAVGLAAVPEPKKSSRRRSSASTTRKRRKPTVRALRAADAMRKNSSGVKSEIRLEDASTTEHAVHEDGSTTNGSQEQ